MVSTRSTACRPARHLERMPMEILCMIVDHVYDGRTSGRAALAKLGQTCKTFHRLTENKRSTRLAAPCVSTSLGLSYASDLLLPYLTMRQWERIRKGNRNLEESPPNCALHIDEFLVGATTEMLDNAGRHKCRRMVEEALWNFREARILALHNLSFFSRLMATSIGLMHNLRALYLDLSKLEDASHLKNWELDKLPPLEHFAYKRRSKGCRGEVDNIVQTIVRRSEASLKSLILSISVLLDRDQRPLKSLRSLWLDNASLNPYQTGCIRRVVDFTELEELILTRYDAGLMSETFIPFLRNSFISAQGEGKAIQLRRLLLRKHGYKTAGEPNQNVSLEAECQFLLTFNTLTTLDLLELVVPSDYVRGPTDSELPCGLLKGILNHTNLTRLRISRAGRRLSQLRSISASTVQTIINGLPHLEFFQFVAEGSLEELGQALACGESLRAIAFEIQDEQNMEESTILCTVLEGFLRAPRCSESQPFLWRDYFKLGSIQVAKHNWWALESAQGREPSDATRYLDVKVQSPERREVRCRRMKSSLDVEYKSNESLFHGDFGPHVWPQSVATAWEEAIRLSMDE